MSKTKKQIRQTGQKPESGFMKFKFDKIIPKKYHTPASLIILVLLFLIFFAPLYFGGKTFDSADIITSKSMTNYVDKHGPGYTLWNPFIFCGMPAYAISVGYKWFNLIYVGITSLRTALTGFFANDYTKWTFYLVLLAFTSFFFIKQITGNNLISLFAGIATSFSTGIIVFLYIGHVTKLTALCMYPLIYLILFRFQKKIKLLDVAILVVALQLMVQGWHVQIIFYTILSIGLYFVYYLIRSIIKKEKELSKQLYKSIGIFILAAGLALLIQIDNFTQIWSYTPYSTRGTKSITELQSPEKKQSESDFYEYATNWSFSPGEVLTFVIPSYYGFGNSTYNGPLTNNQDYKVNTYFGQMMFADVAVGYMGVIVLFLALFAVFTCWKNPLVQFLTILVVLAILISFGRTFSPVFDLMFYYFPFFDKFRIPSMILVLVQLSMPVLAAIGIQKIASLKSEKDVRAEKIIKYAAYIFTGLFLIALIFNSALTDMFITRIIESGKNSGNLKVLNQYVAQMFLSDTLIAFALSALTFWTVYGYINSKLSKDLLLVGIILLTVFDLWRIDKRGAEFTEYKNIESIFAEPGYISIIKKQNDKSPFRILNLEQGKIPGSFNNDLNYNAYFLVQDFYGYSGIKPRAYQDIMDILGTPVNPTIWKMLNVKYIIIDRAINFPGLSFVDSTLHNVVYKTEDVLPRAYFVDKVEVKPMLEVLNAIKNNSFNPKEVAFVEEGKLQIDKPDSTASVNITSYKDEYISIDANASGNNFLFLGDTYFPGSSFLSIPLGGWKAYIDGNSTKIYRVNHGFRGIIVSKGRHKVEFIYAPKSFYVSEYIALSLSSLVIIGLVLGILLELKNKKYQNKKQELKTDSLGE